jgi:hypothetical protein
MDADQLDLKITGHVVRLDALAAAVTRLDEELAS